MVKIGKLFTTFHVQIDVYFNQKLESSPNNAYAYRAYIKVLLSYPLHPKNFPFDLWGADIPDFIDETLNSETPNQGALVHYIRESHALDLIGHPHCDVFRINS